VFGSTMVEPALASLPGTLHTLAATREMIPGCGALARSTYDAFGAFSKKMLAFSSLDSQKSS
jgi:hypothetical protein